MAKTKSAPTETATPPKPPRAPPKKKARKAKKRKAARPAVTKVAAKRTAKRRTRRSVRGRAATGVSRLMIATHGAMRRSRNRLAAVIAELKSLQLAMR